MPNIGQTLWKNMSKTKWIKIVTVLPSGTYKQV